MKGVALNLTRSPENCTVWDGADPLIKGAGHAVNTSETSVKPPPRGLRQHRAAQRQRSNQASDERALGEQTARGDPEYPDQCKKRAGKGNVASDGDRCTEKV